MTVGKLQVTPKVYDGHSRTNIVARRLIRWFSASTADQASTHGILDTNANKIALGKLWYSVKTVLKINAGLYNKNAINVTEFNLAVKYVVAIWVMQQSTSPGWMVEVTLFSQSSTGMSIDCEDGQAVKIDLAVDQMCIMLNRITQCLFSPSELSDIDHFTALMELANVFEVLNIGQIFEFKEASAQDGQTTVSYVAQFGMFTSGSFNSVQRSLRVPTATYSKCIEQGKVCVFVLQLRTAFVNNYIQSTNESSALTEVSGISAATVVQQPTIEHVTNVLENPLTTSQYNGPQLESILFVLPGKKGACVQTTLRSELRIFRKIMQDMSTMHKAGWAFVSMDNSTIGKTRVNNLWRWVLEIGSSDIIVSSTGMQRSNEHGFLIKFLLPAFNIATSASDWVSTLYAAIKKVEPTNPIFANGALAASAQAYLESLLNSGDDKETSAAQSTTITNLADCFPSVDVRTAKSTASSTLTVD